MITFDQYMIGILKQIIDSYHILDQLKDKPGDLDLMKLEVAKINGLLQVIVKKLDSNNEHSSDEYVTLLSLSKSYLENYNFVREIETMSKLYSEDSDRLKNIRYTILKSLNDNNLMEKVDTIIKNLE